jgi:hypothetical protein
MLFVDRDELFFCPGAVSLQQLNSSDSNKGGHKDSTALFRSNLRAQADYQQTYLQELQSENVNSTSLFPPCLSSALLNDLSSILYPFPSFSIGLSLIRVIYSSQTMTGIPSLSSPPHRHPLCSTLVSREGGSSQLPLYSALC